MIVVAAVGVVINLATAMLFARGRESDLNIRGAYLHMAADAGVSAGVVVGRHPDPGDRRRAGSIRPSAWSSPR